MAAFWYLHLLSGIILVSRIFLESGPHRAMPAWVAVYHGHQTALGPTPPLPALPLGGRGQALALSPVRPSQPARVPRMRSLLATGDKGSRAFRF